MTPFLQAARGFEPTVAAFTHARHSLLTAECIENIWSVRSRNRNKVHLCNPPVGFPKAIGCDNCTLLRFAYSLLIVPGKRKLLRSDVYAHSFFRILQPVQLHLAPIGARRPACRFPEGYWTSQDRGKQSDLEITFRVLRFWAEISTRPSE